MQTVFDWLTLAAFAALVVLFLQRSTAEQPTDKLWQYFPPAMGCAVANWLGNHGYAPFAVLVLGAAAAWVVLVLRPFPSRR